MWRKLVLVSLVVLGPCSAWAGQTRIVKAPEEPGRTGIRGLPAITATWWGDRYTLPYNTGQGWQTYVGTAQGLDNVRAAMEAFAARGYIRRADKDTAIGGVGMTTVILGYQIPGVPITERAPFILAQSQAVQYADEEWFPVSIVGGLVMRDSIPGPNQRVVVLSDAPGDEPFTVVLSTNPPPPGGVVNQAGGFTTEADLGIALGFYSGGVGMLPMPYHAYCMMTPTEQTWWNGFGRDVGLGTFNGAVNGAIGGARGAGWAGAVCGALAAGSAAFITNTTTYIATHPYPNPKP